MRDRIFYSVLVWNEAKGTGINMSIVVDCLIDLGMDTGKEYLKDKKNELLLKKEIYSYINEQSNINGICTLEEEIDF